MPPEMGLYFCVVIFNFYSIDIFLFLCCDTMAVENNDKRYYYFRVNGRTSLTKVGTMEA